MKAIHHQSPPLSGLPKLNAAKLHWFSRLSPPGGVLQRHNFYLSNPVRTKATAVTSSHLVVLSVNSPAAATGDFTVLITTSAAFLFLYWIANFVVPQIIMKDLQSDDASKDQKSNEEGVMPSSKTISSEPEKKGFQGTK